MKKIKNKNRIKMKWNIQDDINWRNEIMTQSNKWRDTLGRYGCLVTSLANIIQFIADKIITPKDLNQIIKDIRAYKYLNDSTTPEGQASILIWEKIISFYKDSIDFRLRIDTDEYKQLDDYFYIARINNSFNEDSHYINVFFKSRHYFWCFDVADGKLKTYEPKKILYLHELKRK